MYSAPAIRQDEWVVERLRGKRNGTYIDIGAHDGLHHSNTALLEKYYGWSGVLVEPQPNLYAACFANRSRRNLFLKRPIGPNKASVRFYVGDSYGGICHLMPQEWQDEHKRRKTPVDTYQTITLDELVGMMPRDGMVDYLSLDVEGAELAILERYFLRDPKVHFRLMTIEFRFDGMLLRQMERLLEPWYRLDEVRAFDAFFVHNSLPRRDADFIQAVNHVKKVVA